MMSLRQTKGDDAHLMEEDMNKTLIALATATLAIAATVSQAEAGHGFHIGFGFGGPPIFNSYGNGGGYAPHCNRHVYRVQESAPVHAARKVQPTADVAKVEDNKTVAQNENSSITVAAAKVASVENSSITVASTEPVKITETKKTADAAKAIEPVKTAETKKNEPVVAQKIDCKKFFPSVGLTLTVPCE
jgi:predicted 2-oxoglutarate/Fe(II)-dependent dioxygenase YbiX